LHSARYGLFSSDRIFEVSSLQWIKETFFVICWILTTQFAAGCNTNGFDCPNNYFGHVESSLPAPEGGYGPMKTNVEIIQETIEQIVNQKKIDLWDTFFSPDYIAHGAPFIGMGFSSDTSGNKHIIDYVFPGSPAEGKLQAGDEIVWVEDGAQRWETFEEISKGLQGRQYRVGLRRGDQTFACELTRDYMEGLGTPTAQAKAEMTAFITKDFPDLTAAIKLILAEGDQVVCLLEYRGTHAKYDRESVWREAWFTRLSEGQIVESWPIIDESAFFRHLGYRLIPPGG
jgi:predicted ester cyclase